MGKKKIKKGSKAIQQQVNIKMLPQNIVSMGEHVEENKNIYISQPAYKVIHKFAGGKTVNESGGMLIGYIIEEFGKTNIVITGFVEAKYCEATPTTLKFTHETWEYCHKQLNEKYPCQKIVGWIHTHPDFGIFLSEYDKFIQNNFFKEEYQIAYVVDPIQNIEGFYFWINGNIERCKGFYVFDKTGNKITVSDKNGDDDELNKSETDIFSIKNIIIAVLAAALILLSFFFISLKGEMNILKQSKDSIAESANQRVSALQQQVNYLQNIINELEKANQKTDEKEDSSSTASSLPSESAAESETSSH